MFDRYTIGTSITCFYSTGPSGNHFIYRHFEHFTVA